MCRIYFSEYCRNRQLDPFFHIKVLQFTIIYLANLFEDKNGFHRNYFLSGQRLIVIRYDFILFNLLRKHVFSLNNEYQCRLFTSNLVGKYHISNFGHKQSNLCM